VYNEALNCLLSLTRNLFHEPRLVVEKFESEKFHGPLVILKEIKSNHWAWAPLFHQEIHLDENRLTEFLIRTQLSTFILITILKEEFSGSNLLYIK
jgi:hypothetical protein